MTKVLLMILTFNILTFCMGQMIHLKPSDFRRLARMGRGYSPVRGVLIEPTCEELKAMWRFTRRQARASELTNDVPVFKDPFAYNIWQKYPKMRTSMNALTSPRPTGRLRSRPVYGRVVNAAPSDHPRAMNPEPKKYYGVVRYFEPTEEEQARRNFGLAKTFGYPNRKQKGSFDKLKELVWEERMKELDKKEPARIPPAISTAVDQSPASVRNSLSVPASQPGAGRSLAPVPTRFPPESPTPKKDVASSKPYELSYEGQEVSVPVSRSYNSAFQGEGNLAPVPGPNDLAFRGQERSGYTNPYNKNRSTRMKIISDFFRRRNYENAGNEYDYEEGVTRRDPAYGTPYRFNQVFVDDPPNYDY